MVVSFGGICFALAAMIKSSYAIIRVLHPPEHAGKVWETVHFSYYGLSSITVNESAFVVDDTVVCAHKGHPFVDEQASSLWLKDTFASIRGEPKIALNSGPHCDPFAMYDLLLTAGEGLKTLVLIGTSTNGVYPEYDVFEHASWKICKHCSSELVLLSAPDPDGSLSWLTLRAGPSLRLSVGPPHNNISASAYESAWWILVVRIFCPIVALTTAISAGLQLKCSGNRSVRSLFCAIELTQSLIMSALFSLGQGGPHLLPCYVHGGFVVLLLGHSISGALILAAFLHEEYSVRRGRSRLSIFVRHRLKLVIALTFFLGIDLIIAAVSISGNYSRKIYFDILVVFICVCYPVQFAVLIYYLWNVRYHALDCEFILRLDQLIFILCYVVFLFERRLSSAFQWPST